MSEPQDPAAPEPRDHKHEPHLTVHRFGVVLALLFATFIFLASGPTGDWVPFVSSVLQGATLLAALSASGVSRRLQRFALLLVLVSLALGLSVWLSGIEAGSGFLLLLNALLVAMAPFVIARALVRRGMIDLQTVMGALCIYVLLGMLWAFTFGTIGALGEGPFFAQQSDATVADFLYFSFVTLTTTGYGDLTAAGGLGRAVAVLEALLGQLYLVTVVALIVSRLGRRGTARSGGASEGAAD